ncbi:HPF/RaiA family ribosome-associated protein [Foetidibacter luteolus]|uniref:HPF/RaiA family ribosome-associated protein n=1 Tax=Foetidibacter luteolus TaxID=2608880 RepID=UPI001A97F48D|nr:HPF/RaiA family ribosome-associated protein [Foetidibacter luteolus]
MTIQINTDNNLSVKDAYEENLNQVLNKELGRFEEYLTRIEVHFSDENADRKTSNDKRCSLEARLKGKQPVVVSHDADTYDEAIAGAARKMKSTLTSIIEKQRGY